MHFQVSGAPTTDTATEQTPPSRGYNTHSGTLQRKVSVPPADVVSARRTIAPLCRVNLGAADHDFHLEGIIQTIA